MVYLMKSTDCNGTWFKVGFTTNLAQRLIPYFTHNPSCQLLETIKTYRKTRQQLETEIHAEIVKMGFQFNTAPNGSKTEWFFVPAFCETEFEKKGLSQFKACKNRVITKK